MNKYLHFCERIIEDFPSSNSQKLFAQSVKTQIEKNPVTYPSPAQARIIENMYRHYIKRQPQDDVEKCVLGW